MEIIDEAIMSYKDKYYTNPEIVYISHAVYNKLNVPPNTTYWYRGIQLILVPSTCSNKEFAIATSKATHTWEQASKKSTTSSSAEVSL